MLYSIDKAVGLARDLSDILKIRLAQSPTALSAVRQSQDANGWPMIFLSSGNEAEAQPVIAIRISNIDVGAKDVFQNASLPFAPHQCEVACELNPGSFTVSSANATVGAVYTSAAGQSFTVGSTIAPGTVLSVNGILSPSASSGTLTKISGTGDATITYSAFSGFSPYPANSALAMVIFQVARTGMILVQEFAPNGTAVTEAAMNAALAAATPSQFLRDIDWANKGNV